MWNTHTKVPSSLRSLSRRIDDLSDSAPVTEIRKMCQQKFKKLWNNEIINKNDLVNIPQVKKGFHCVAYFVYKLQFHPLF